MAALAAYFATDSYFIVQPTEMAGVRRLGNVHSTEPVQPGLHLKAPFIRFSGQNPGFYRQFSHR